MKKGLQLHGPFYPDFNVRADTPYPFLGPWQRHGSGLPKPQSISVKVSALAKLALSPNNCLAGFVESSAVPAPILPLIMVSESCMRLAEL